MSSPDSLSVTSRGFYERAKNKVAGSIFLAAACLTLLGFCAAAGGISNSNTIVLDEVDDDGDYADTLKARSAGTGIECQYILLSSA